MEVHEAQERIRSQEKNLEQAQEGLRLAQLRYANGLSRQIEVLDAQVALTTARANYLQAVFDYQAASARLDRAMGKEV